MRKVAVGCLTASGLIVLAVVVLGTYFYTMYWRPLAGPLSVIFMQQTLDQRIDNQAAYLAPDDGVLTEEQVARFIRVAQGIEARLGAPRIQAMASAAEAIRQAAKGGDSLPVRTLLPLLADIRADCIGAKYTQVDGLNANGLSKDEYQWIRKEAFQAAGIDLTELDFDDLLAGIENAQVKLVVTPAGDARPEANVVMAAPHAAELKRWLTLAFFRL
jgi:hypothetical protein